MSATLELIEERGLAAVSMRAVATRLGCEAMSLYWYVPNKAALLNLVAEAVVAEIRVPDPHEAWDEAICDLMRELRRVALHYPAAFQLVIRGPVTSVGARPLDAGMQALMRGGLDPEHAARALCAALAFVIGAIGNELAANEVGGPLARAADPDEPAWQDAQHALRFLEVMQDTSYEAEFEAGLKIFLRAFAA